MIIVIVLLCLTVGLSAAMINATLEDIVKYLQELAKRERARHEN